MTDGPRRRAEPTIVHVDLDAFFVAVEVRRRPELAGLPVLVGGAGPRGVVAAASYEARVSGARSAMPMATARRLCPGAVVLPGDHGAYEAASREVMDLLRSFTPLVEPLSVDEAFCDVAGARRLFGPVEQVCGSIRARMAAELGLSCSVGAACVKFLAKLASEAAKPVAAPGGPRPGPGVVVVGAGEELAFLHPLPVETLWGVGPATLGRLGALGVVTVGDLAALDPAVLERAVGRAAGAHLGALARADDPRGVVTGRDPVSIGHEETFPVDLHERAAVALEVTRLADAVASRLHTAGVAARTATLKVRDGSFRTRTHSVTPGDALGSGPALARAVRPLLDRVDLDAGVRLLGLSATNLVAAGDAGVQLRLDASDPGRWSDATGAVEAIRDRYGADAIGPAALVRSEGLERLTRGQRPWGPDSPDAASGPAPGGRQ